MSNQTTTNPFKIGDRVRINDTFRNEYKTICDNYNWNYNCRIKRYEGIFEVTKIYEDVCLFGEPNKNGQPGFASRFLEIAT